MVFCCCCTGLVIGGRLALGPGCVCKSLHSPCSNGWRCLRWWNRLAVFPIFVGTCARHHLQCTLLCFVSDLSSLTPWAVSSVVSSKGKLIFCFYTAAAAQTNTPRLAAGMALFQPRDWFSAAQLSLSLAIRLVCQKMDDYNLSKSISTVFHMLSLSFYRPALTQNIKYGTLENWNCGKNAFSYVLTVNRWDHITVLSFVNLIDKRVQLLRPIRTVPCAQNGHLD